MATSLAQRIAEAIEPFDNNQENLQRRLAILIEISSKAGPEAHRLIERIKAKLLAFAATAETLVNRACGEAWRVKMWELVESFGETHGIAPEAERVLQSIAVTFDSPITKIAQSNGSEEAIQCILERHDGVL